MELLQRVLALVAPNYKYETIQRIRSPDDRQFAKATGQLYPQPSWEVTSPLLTSIRSHIPEVVCPLANPSQPTVHPLQALTHHPAGSLHTSCIHRYLTSTDA